jgi:hypothetical protein
MRQETPFRNKSYISIQTKWLSLAEGVLSTWSSANSVGFVKFGGGGKLWLGDADLNQAINIKSINATVLEFDFIPLTNY